MTASLTWPVGGGVTWHPSRSRQDPCQHRPQQIVHVSQAPSDNAWAHSSLPPWVAAIEKPLLDIAGLGPGWDGERAQPMSMRAFKTALNVLAETMANDSVPPQIVPTYDGGLQLEWHCAGVDLEVYVEPNGQVSAWFREGGREWEEHRYPRARLSRELSLLTQAYAG